MEGKVWMSFWMVAKKLYVAIGESDEGSAESAPSAVTTPYNNFRQFYQHNTPCPPNL